MKIKINFKSLDNDKYISEIEKFKKLGYKVHSKLNYYIILSDYKDEDFNNYTKRIHLYLESHQAVKYNAKGHLEPFTKQELKILDLHDWDLPKDMDQETTDWIWME